MQFAYAFARDYRGRRTMSPSVDSREYAVQEARRLLSYWSVTVGPQTGNGSGDSCLNRTRSDIAKQRRVSSAVGFFFSFFFLGRVNYDDDAKLGEDGDTTLDFARRSRSPDHVAADKR